jgi:hypothetical protein
MWFGVISQTIYSEDGLKMMDESPYFVAHRAIVMVIRLTSVEGSCHASMADEELLVMSPMEQLQRSLTDTTGRG